MSKVRILPSQQATRKLQGIITNNYSIDRSLTSPRSASAIPAPLSAMTWPDVRTRKYFLQRGNSKTPEIFQTRPLQRPIHTKANRPVHAAILRLVLTPGQQQPSLGGNKARAAPISGVHHTPPANHVHGTYAPCNAMLHTRAAAHIYPPSIALRPRRPLFLSRRQSLFVKSILNRNISSFSLKLSC